MTLPPDALARPPPASPADALRAWGLAHPVVAFVAGVLDRDPGQGGPPGLYADAEHAPWVCVKGELRVSLVRVYSVGEHGRQLVGQVQVTEREDEHRDRRLRAFVHWPAVGRTDEVPSLDRWWLEVIERHYVLGGSSLDFSDHVPVSA